MDIKWEKTTHEVYSGIYNQHRKNLCVFESYTATRADEKLTEQQTSWGFLDADHPIIRSTLRDGEWSYFILLSTYYNE